MAASNLIDKSELHDGKFDGDHDRIAFAGNRLEVTIFCLGGRVVGKQWDDEDGGSKHMHYTE